MEKHYDIVVIGSGAGLKIADYAAKNGYKVAVIEKGPFGGTCVNRGCIPSKMLIYPSDLIQMIRSGKRLNIDSGEVKVNFSNLVQRVIKKTDSLAEKIQGHYEGTETIDVYPTHATFLDERKVRVDDIVITADRFYLAIGTHPKVPSIEGLEKTPYLTSDGVLCHDIQPKRILVIGGGLISAELSHFYSTMGTEVEIFSRSPFLKNLDEDIRKVFLDEFQKSHTLHENSSIKKVSYKKNEFTLEYKNSDKEMVITKADALLVATGREAWSGNIGIENTPIRLDKEGFIQVDEFLKTNAHNTWAFGDCIGHNLFRHMANFEADYLVKQLSTKETSPILYPPIPYAIFSHPQIGVVGKTEKELKKEERDLFIGVSNYEGSDMGKARRSRYGMVKLIFDRKNEHLVSAQIIGDEAATMIHILIAFMQMSAKLEDLIQSIFIHPALPEIISSAALNAKQNKS